MVRIVTAQLLHFDLKRSRTWTVERPGSLYLKFKFNI